MADLDIETAQLIIQLARDDIYQLGDNAQNEGLLSDLEFALAAQELEFMQRWTDYGDAQFNPGTRTRGQSTGDSSRNTGNTGIQGNRDDQGNHLGNDGPSLGTSAPTPNTSTDDEEDSGSDLSNTPAFSNDVRSNNPPRPTITIPSSSSLIGRNHISVQNRNNNDTKGQPPITLDPDGTEGASTSLQITNSTRTVTSISFTRSLPSNDDDLRDDEELSSDEDDSTSSVIVHETRPSISVDCYFCKESCPISATIHTPCRHHLCQTCITRLIEVCIQDETTYPPKCCGNKLQINELHLTDRNLRQRYALKVREYDTPVSSRVYCYQCIRFLDSNAPTVPSSLGSRVPARVTKFCSTCSLWTCTQCKRADHRAEPCQEAPEDKVFRSFAKQNGWQTCPNCKAVVERNGGCNHMTCKCSTQFCYFCATRWKLCAC